MTSPFIQILGSYFLQTVEISIHASLIIGVLLVIRPLIKSFLPPRWVYALWFIVVARLLLIELPSLPEVAIPPVQNALAVVQSVDGESSTNPDVGLASALPSTPGSSAITWLETLAVGWLTGAACFLFHFGLGTFRWSRRLAKAPTIQTPETCQLLEECCQEMRIRQVRLVQLPSFASPSITGLFRPIIILPEDFLERFSPEELRWILLHELAHLKRWDLPVQVLCQLLQAVHWFNPLVWFAFSCFRCDRELACDAYVLDRQATKTSRDYGYALIKVAETYPRSFSSPGFLGIAEAKTDLQERVEKISRHRRPAMLWIVSGATLCGLLAVAFLTKTVHQAPHEATVKISIYSSDGGVPAEIEVIQSLNTVVPAVVNLGLDKSWAKGLDSNESVLTPAEIMERISKILTVKQAGSDPQIVYITVQDNDAKEAADIANAIVKQYADARYAQAVKDAMDSANKNYGKQISDVSAEVAELQANLEKLRQDTSHPADTATLQVAQNKLNDEQKYLDGIKTQNQQFEDQVLRSAGVRILAPAY